MLPSRFQGQRSGQVLAAGSARQIASSGTVGAAGRANTAGSARTAQNHLSIRAGRQCQRRMPDDRLFASVQARRRQVLFTRRHEAGWFLRQGCVRAWSGYRGPRKFLLRYRQDLQRCERLAGLLHGQGRQRQMQSADRSAGEPGLLARFDRPAMLCGRLCTFGQFVLPDFATDNDGRLLSQRAVTRRRQQECLRGFGAGRSESTGRRCPGNRSMLLAGIDSCRR